MAVAGNHVAAREMTTSCLPSPFMSATTTEPELASETWAKTRLKLF
jgi:hypothetical protein